MELSAEDLMAGARSIMAETLNADPYRPVDIDYEQFCLSTPDDKGGWRCWEDGYVRFTMDENQIIQRAKVIKTLKEKE